MRRQGDDRGDGAHRRRTGPARLFLPFPRRLRRGDPPIPRHRAVAGEIAAGALRGDRDGADAGRRSASPRGLGGDPGREDDRGVVAGRERHPVSSGKTLLPFLPGQNQECPPLGILRTTQSDPALLSRSAATASAKDVPTPNRSTVPATTRKKIPIVQRPATSPRNRRIAEAPPW